MADTGNYLFIASMDVAADVEELFNEVYDQEHVPALMQVPGVVSVMRYQNRPFAMAMAGTERRIEPKGEPRYVAVYEIESPDVLLSAEWAKAVEAGRWPAEIRPHTSNLRQQLLAPG